MTQTQPTPAFDKTSTAEHVTEGADLTGQTWLVTGVNSGLGFETARVLAMRGAHVIGTARTAEKARAAFARLGVDGTPVSCELTDLGSVRAAVSSVTNLRPLRGIVANAGVMAIQDCQQVHGYEKQLFTNHVGHFVLVTGLVERVESGGRFVILSSGAHRMAKRGLELDNLSGEDDYAAWRMYGRSKLANIFFARSLSRRLEGTGRTANSLHPGVIETNLGRHVPNREAMYGRLKDVLKTVEQGAATQCWAAVHPALEGVTGEYFSDCAVENVLWPEGDIDELGEQLWSVTEEIVAAV